MSSPTSSYPPSVTTTQAATAERAELFKKLTSFSSVQDVILKPNNIGVGLQVYLATRNHARNVKERRVLESFISRTPPMPDASETLHHLYSTMPLDVNESVVLRASRYSEALQTTVQVLAKSITPPDGGPKKRFLEINQGPTDFFVFDVTKSHGDFYPESISFSPSTQKFVYIAERIIPEEKDTTDSDGFTVPVDKFAYEYDFGEGLVGKTHPVLVVIDIQKARKQSKNTYKYKLKKLNNAELEVEHSELAVCVIDAPPSDRLAVTSPIFVREDWLIFVGISNHPLKYGIRYCHNRLSYLYGVNSNGIGMERLFSSSFPGEPEVWNVRSPRLSPDRLSMIFLSHPVGGPHAGCSRLVFYSFRGQAFKIVLDIVRAEPNVTTYPGLFVDSLPTDCYIDEDTVLANSSWCGHEALVAISLSAGKVKDIGMDFDPVAHKLVIRSGFPFSWNALAASESWLVGTVSAVNCPPALVLGHFGKKSRKVDEWRVILGTADQSPDIHDSLNFVHCAIRYVPDRPWTQIIHVFHAVNGVADFSALARTPLIVMPHGGPHGMMSTAYSASIAALVLSGFHVALVNYTGSTGFGQSCIEALIGKIGIQDVQDTQAAAVFIREKLAEKSVAKAAIMGGSHGGFLAAHILGQFPKYYTCGVLRNPVTNVPSMIESSDIPDWCWAEAGEPFSLERPSILTPEAYRRMFEKSPFAWAPSVIAPTLVMLGDSDRRVPKSQGLRWAEFLQGQVKPVTVLMYKGEGHPLDGVEAEREGFLSYASFLIKHSMS